MQFCEEVPFYDQYFLVFTFFYFFIFFFKFFLTVLIFKNISIFLRTKFVFIGFFLKRALLNQKLVV